MVWASVVAWLAGGDWLLWSGLTPLGRLRPPSPACCSRLAVALGAPRPGAALRCASIVGEEGLAENSACARAVIRLWSVRLVGGERRRTESFPRRLRGSVAALRQRHRVASSHTAKNRNGSHQRLPQSLPLWTASFGYCPQRGRVSYLQRQREHTSSSERERREEKLMLCFHS